MIISSYHVVMKQPLHVGVAELKKNLSKYLRDVRAGERSTVCDRDKQVAQLVPAADTGAFRVNMRAANAPWPPHDFPTMRLMSAAEVDELLAAQREETR